uniref:Uncharacterized protein n=1 Tax=Arundo donax TaxID=35708 RepID=A0A0A9BP23_ARUDO
MFFLKTSACSGDVAVVFFSQSRGSMPCNRSSDSRIQPCHCKWSRHCPAWSFELTKDSLACCR